MPRWHIHALSYPSPYVLDAAVAAAEELGFGITQVDEAGGHVYLTFARPFGRRPWAVDIAVTDSGLGTSILRVGWETAAAVPAAFSAVGRQAARLPRHCQAHLRAWFAG